ncbi:MAG: alpha/beta fold hydrolase, partial [Hyphomicrobiaceae bacterium]
MARPIPAEPELVYTSAMPFARIDHLKLETRLIPGPAHRPWLVFLHEGLGSVSLWRDFPDKLAQRLSCPALIYARQGYGQSTGLAGPRQPDFMHREALDVLPRLLAHYHIGKTVLIGHSDGASIALIHAASHPQTTAAMTLMAPHVFTEQI